MLALLGIEKSRHLERQPILLQEAVIVPRGLL